MSESQKYIVSARKYRPATFRSVVGQKTLTVTLKNAIATDRLAQAYLFCGPRGVGKTSCARIFAKTINCLDRTPDGEACGKCASCLAMDEGNSFNVTELDAASNNSVDDIRALTDQVGQRPQGGGKYRVFIIDEVHMLSSQAFNAFLKTLEEPPSYVIFILATTEKHKVIPTILSRCQIYDFKRITVQDMVDHLQYVALEEGITAEPSALGVIARKADGAMRDALYIFDQVAASSRGNITYQSTIDNLNVLDHDFYFRLVEAFRAGNVPDSLLLFADIRSRGFDPLFFVGGLAGHIRDLMMAADQRTLPLLEAADDIAARFSEQAATLPLQWYYAAMKILSDTDINYRTSGNKQLLVELALIRLCQLLNPPTPPFDRIDEGIPLRAPIMSPQTGPQTSAATPSAPGSAATGHTATAQASQPSAPAQPAVPVAPPRPARRATRRTSTLRISEAVETQRASEPGAGIDERVSEVTTEALRGAWLDFAAMHPELHILASAMRGATPSVSPSGEITCTVSHPAQAQAFESAMTPLMQHLRDMLHNDRLTLRVEIDATPADTCTLPPQEFLKKAVEDNPGLGALLSAIDAELA